MPDRGEQSSAISPQVSNGAVASVPRRRRLPRLSALLADNSTVLVVVALIVVFGLTSTYFFTAQNFFNILKHMSIVGVLGIGMTMVILVGGVDLSVGSIVLISGGVSAVLMANQHVPTILAIPAGLLTGTLIGLINGVLVEVVQISPVIATLGVLIAIRGLGQIVINNSWVWVTDSFFVKVASGRVLFLPIMATIMLVLYAVAALSLSGTRFGRQVYAIGGNQTAARLCGLPVIRTKVMVYVLSGFCAAIGGLLTAASLGVVGPNVGAGLEFDAIAAVVLGGTRLGGGVGRVERTLLGTAILTMVLNYLTIRGIPDIWQTTVTGFLVLGAVLLDRLLGRRKEE